MDVDDTEVRKQNKKRNRRSRKRKTPGILHLIYSQSYSHLHKLYETFIKS